MNAPTLPSPAQDSGIERLAGSSPPTGTAPSFTPIAAASASEPGDEPASSDLDAEAGQEQRELDEADSFLREHARGVFEPCDGECPLPSDTEWTALANPYLVSLRMGWQILIKSKAKLVIMVDEALSKGDVFDDTDFVSGTLDRLAHVEDWLNGLRLMARAASTRLKSAAAVQDLQERGIAFEEGPAVSPLALDAYDEWLHMERRMVAIEKYGLKNAREMGRFVPRTAADAFHFPKEAGKSWKDVPPPSDRAEAILDLLGIDWRRDGWRTAEANRANAAEVVDAEAGQLVDDVRFTDEAA